MSFESIEDVCKINAPYGKELAIQTVTYEGGMQLLRVRIKEGKRFTMLDLDPDTANQLVDIFSQWQNNNKE